MDQQLMPASVHCPRCGYDQRGVVATWRDACALRTSCTECGLLIEWAELLSAKRKYPRWCFEYGRGFFDAIKRFFLTIALTFWPWKMWRSLQMSHEIRWGRIAHRVGAAWCLALAAAYVAERISLVLALHWSVLPARSGTTSVGMVNSMTTSLFAPWSEQSPGWITLSYNTQTGIPGAGVGARTFAIEYPSPHQLQPFVIGSWYVPRYTHNEMWRLVRSVCIFASCICVISPLVFVVLPAARREAKVRWSHVWRVMIYNLLWLFCLLIVIIVARLLMPWSYDAATSILRVTPTTFVGWPIATVLFWQAAIRHYLKMSRSWAVALSVGTIAWLASGAAVFYINNPMSPSEMWEWTRRVFA